MNSYSIIPECVYETNISFALGTSWYQSMLSFPENAQVRLQRHRVDYFIIDLEKELFDFFSFSALSLRDNTQKYLGGLAEHLFS